MQLVHPDCNLKHSDYSQGFKSLIGNTNCSSIYPFVNFISEHSNSLKIAEYTLTHQPMVEANLLWQLKKLR